MSLALLTDPRKDLVNLNAVLPQVNHRRQIHMQPVTSILKRTRSQNDISNLYPSLYCKSQKKEEDKTKKSQSIQEKKKSFSSVNKPPPTGEKLSSSKQNSRKAIPINFSNGD